MFYLLIIFLLLMIFPELITVPSKKLYHFITTKKESDTKVNNHGMNTYKFYDYNVVTNMNDPRDVGIGDSVQEAYKDYLNDVKERQVKSKVR